MFYKETSNNKKKLNKYLLSKSVKKIIFDCDFPVSPIIIPFFSVSFKCPQFNPSHVFNFAFGTWLQGAATKYFNQRSISPNWHLYSFQARKKKTNQAPARNDPKRRRKLNTFYLMIHYIDFRFIGF